MKNCRKTSCLFLLWNFSTLWFYVKRFSMDFLRIIHRQILCSPLGEQKDSKHMWPWPSVVGQRSLLPSAILLVCFAEKSFTYITDKAPGHLGMMTH